MTTATTPVVSHLSQYFIFVVPRALSFSNKRDVCDVLCWYVRRDTSGGAPPAPIPTCIQMLLLLLLFLLLKSIKTTKDITVGIQNKNKLIFSFVFRKCSLQCGSFWYTLSCFVYFSPYYLFVLLLKQKQNTRVSFYLLLVEGVGAVHINYTQPTICLSVVNVWWVLLSLCCVRELRELTEKTIIYSLAASQASYFFRMLAWGYVRMHIIPADNIHLFIPPIMSCTRRNSWHAYSPTYTCEHEHMGGCHVAPSLITLKRYCWEGVTL